MRKLIVFTLVGFFYVALGSAAFYKADLISQKKNQLVRQGIEKKELSLPADDFLLGQNFIVGIPGKELDEATKDFLQQIKPAGIILYYRNYETREQFEGLIAELQKFGKETTGYPYFIMIDEEPGGATRLNLFKNVFAFGVPEWGRIEEDIKEMALAGINVNLAPLADFPFNEDSFIEKRVPAHTQEALMDFNSKFISLLQANSISATLKHFPGMGVFIDDPHKKLPQISGDKEILEESINIFKDGVDSGVHFVMTGHAVYDSIDLGVPATLSKKITTDILRNQLGFKGLVITDDLSDMPFIIGRNIDLTTATAESLRAGHNLVIFSHNPNKTLDVFKKLLLRFQDDQEIKVVAEQNYRNIISFKLENLKTSFQ